MRIEKKKKKIVTIIGIVFIPLIIIGIVLGAGSQLGWFSPIVAGQNAPVMTLNSPDPSIDGDVSIEWTRTIIFDFRNKYDLYRSTNGGAWSLIRSNTGYMFTENLPNGNYRYRVRGKEFGVYTGYSNIISVTVKIEFVPVNPLPTTLFQITPNPNQDGNVIVKWTVGVPNAIAYRLYRSEDNINFIEVREFPEPNSMTTLYSFHDTVVDGNTYYYKMKSIGVYGNSDFSNMVYVTISLYKPPPDAPVLQNFLPYINVGSEALVRWSSVLDATGYDIYRSKDNSIFSLIKTTSAISYVDTGLSNGVYTYKIKAKSINGDSGFSNSKSVSIVIPTVPDAPNLYAFNPLIDLDGNINVQWLGNLDSTSYDIYRSINGGTFSFIKNTHLSSYSISGLSIGVYTFKIKAKNAIGDSVFSNEQ